MRYRRHMQHEATAKTLTQRQFCSHKSSFPVSQQVTHPLPHMYTANEKEVSRPLIHPCLIHWALPAAIKLPPPLKRRERCSRTAFPSTFPSKMRQERRKALQPRRQSAATSVAVQHEKEATLAPSRANRYTHTNTRPVQIYTSVRRNTCKHTP